MENESVNKQKNQLDHLSKLHMRAIELRYEGKTHAEISEVLTNEFGKKHKLDKIMHWFAHGGRLELAYLDFAKKENERRRQLVMEQMKQVLELIPQKALELLSRKATNPFTGETLRDKDGKPISKADMVTVATLKLLMEALGFKVPAGTDEHDPMEEWIEQMKAELAKNKPDAK